MAVEQRQYSVDQTVGYLLAQQKSTDGKVDGLAKKHEEMDKKLDQLLLHQAEHNSVHERYKGWVGGALFVSSAVWALVLAGWHYIFK